MAWWMLEGGNASDRRGAITTRTGGCAGAARGAVLVLEDVNIHRAGRGERCVNDAEIDAAICWLGVGIHWSHDRNRARKLSNCNHCVLRSRVVANGAGHAEDLGGGASCKPGDFVTTRRHTHVS